VTRILENIFEFKSYNILHCICKFVTYIYCIGYFSFLIVSVLFPSQNTFLSSFIQAMAVYNHLSKKNEVISSSLDKTEKSAEYFSDKET
jgi:hypothetical protein